MTGWDWAVLVAIALACLSPAIWSDAKGRR